MKLLLTFVVLLSSQSHANTAVVIPNPLSQRLYQLMMKTTLEETLDGVSRSDRAVNYDTGEGVRVLRGLMIGSPETNGDGEYFKCTKPDSMGSNSCTITHQVFPESTTGLSKKLFSVLERAYADERTTPATEMQVQKSEDGNTYSVGSVSCEQRPSSGPSDVQVFQCQYSGL